MHKDFLKESGLQPVYPFFLYDYCTLPYKHAGKHTIRFFSVSVGKDHAFKRGQPQLMCVMVPAH